MECEDCLEYECVCADENVRRDMLATLLELMHQKVYIFRKIMQERVLMIQEDIVTTITEETIRFQNLINNKITRLDLLMTEIQEIDANIELSPDVVEAMSFNMDLNLDSENIQIAFNSALKGEFIIFREVLKSSQNSGN